MPSLKNLHDILLKQKSILSELEAEVASVTDLDIINENEVLKEELQTLRLNSDKLKEDLKSLSLKNSELKNALYEQIYNEKLTILKAAQKKNDIYFKSEVDGEVNRLIQVQMNLNNRINIMVQQLKKERVDTSNELYGNLRALSEKASELIKEIRAKTSNESLKLSSYSSERFEELKNEQLNEDSINAISKKNNLEAFVGGNLLNKLGILFVILGIIAISRYTIFKLPDTFKGIIMFVISLALLVSGELLNRKKANIFSLGITGGGVAGLFVSLSISYFGLRIISMYPAIILCILITAGAFVLSQRYNSQTIAAFALIGGYIPIISISGNIVLTYSAMMYFVVLNLLALSFSFYKKWRIAMFIGYFLNLTGSLYIIFGILSSGYSDGFDLKKVCLITYILFAFAIYTVIPIISNYRNRLTFTKPDVILMGMNTAISSMIMYAVFYALNLGDFTGLMAIIFAVIYLYLGRLIETRFSGESPTVALFYLTGLTFVVLVIPFQLGMAWVSIGWLVEGVCLSVYGILRKENSLKKSGYVIFALCILAFIVIDVPLNSDYLFAGKYFSVTLGSIIILASLAYKKDLFNSLEIFYKYAVALNAWIYGLYLIYLIRLNGLFYSYFLYSAYNMDFLLSALGITFTFLFAFILPFVPVIADKGIRVLAVCLSVFGMLWLMITVNDGLIIAVRPVPVYITVIGTITLVLLCILAVLSMRRVMLHFVLERNLPAQWLPFIISAYFLFVLTQMLICQYGLYFTSIIISIIYVVAAFFWIIYGFIKRYLFMRRFGLGLCVLAVAKLFLLDLPDLTPGHKIVSYFAFGITLLGISFVYQYFIKRLSAKGD